MINNNKSKFIEFKEKSYDVLFSTGDNNVSYNMADSGLKQKFSDLCSELAIDDICYLKQIHSDKIFVCDEDNKYHGDYEGDALITTLKRNGVGIFTADCVPVLIADNKNKVVAAVHSGWRSTIANIVGKTIMRMQDNYGCSCDNIRVYIGPHNKICCYEVSEELISEFKNVDYLKNADINKGRFLSLENCIIEQCKINGVKEKNIITSDYCTFCSENVKFHSYRKTGKDAGRQFSLIYIK